MIRLATMLLIVQILFIIHALKTGRDWWWVLIILFFPVIGCVVYFALEVLDNR